MAHCDFEDDEKTIKDKFRGLRPMQPTLRPKLEAQAGGWEEALLRSCRGAAEEAGRGLGEVWEEAERLQSIYASGSVGPHPHP